MTKVYELPNGRKVTADFDENGIAKITEQALDSLIRDLNYYANECKEKEPSIEKLKDKLHDKIEIHVCEVEENDLIAQGMLKALGMMDEVLENAEKGGE